jgi:hypothetical protein
MTILFVRSLVPMIFTMLAFTKYGAGTRGLAAVATVVDYSYAY